MSDQVAALAHALRVKDVLVLDRRGVLRLQGGFDLGAALRIADERMYRAKREPNV